MSEPDRGALLALPTPCRTRSLYVLVNGRRYGVEVESRRSPRYVEVRLIRRGRVSLWTHRAPEGG